MNKEQALEIWKDGVRLLESYKGKPMFKLSDDDRKKIIEIKVRIESAIKDLNSCDAVWVSEEYTKWFKKEMYPKHKAEIEMIKKNFPS